MYFVYKHIVTSHHQNRILTKEKESISLFLWVCSAAERRNFFWIRRIIKEKKKWSSSVKKLVKRLNNLWNDDIIFLCYASSKKGIIMVWRVTKVSIVVAEQHQQTEWWWELLWLQFLLHTPANQTIHQNIIILCISSIPSLSFCPSVYMAIIIFILVPPQNSQLYIIFFLAWCDDVMSSYFLWGWIKQQENKTSKYGRMDTSQKSLSQLMVETLTTSALKTDSRTTKPPPSPHTYVHDIIWVASPNPGFCWIFWVWVVV